MAENLTSKNVSRSVEERILQGNPWYVDSHFEWAGNPSVKFIYKKRFEYFIACIEKAKSRLGPNLRLLDAGCGDGYWLARLSEVQGLSLIGLDYNPLRVDRARLAIPHVGIFVSDLQSFEAKKSFDVILLNQVIEHVEDDIALLRKARMLLHQGGVLILGTTNEGSCLQQLWINIKGKAFQTDHIHFYTEDEVRCKVCDAGFSIDSVMREVFFLGSYHLYYWLTKREWGFKLLEYATRLWPSQCSDFYFECRVPMGNNGNAI